MWLNKKIKWRWLDARAKEYLVDKELTNNDSGISTLKFNHNDQRAGDQEGPIQGYKGRLSTL